MNAFVASLLTVVVAASLARSAAAQNPDGERAQAEIQRTQRQLQQNRAEVDRLLELRLHDVALVDFKMGILTGNKLVLKHNLRSRTRRHDCGFVIRGLSGHRAGCQPEH